jgi:ribosomal protein S18 acetylase RimI-like enzyme
MLVPMRREDVVMTTIRRATDDDHEPIVDLSLRAWEPVFASMAEVVGPTLFRHLFTGDWRTYQADDVRRACGAYDVFVATDGDRVVGFTAVDLPADVDHGEIYMIAVDPDHQGRGVGLRLTQTAIEHMRAAGRHLAIVNTGGDPGHAAARATYERAGFTSLPAEQYFLALE